MFNEKTAVERRHPDYARAGEAEPAARKAGVRNFPGIVIRQTSPDDLGRATTATQPPDAQARDTSRRSANKPLARANSRHPRATARSGHRTDALSLRGRINRRIPKKERRPVAGSGTGVVMPVPA